VMENDTVSINVRNHLISEAITIHWHGIHPYETPWTDGAIGVTQAGIRPGENFTYEFKAWPGGTHYWHSHMDGMQSAKGVRGPFIVKTPTDTEGVPHYDEEQVLVLADEWRDPDVCLKLEGAMAGNDVCADVDHASLNGQVAWGDLQVKDADLKSYPFPLVDVEKGKCYRLRLIMMASNVENYVVSIAGHNMTLIALDGEPVVPLQVTALNMHIGERADVIVCANQEPGYYPIQMTYDYACALTPGNFIPPGFHAVSACNFYSFLHYAKEPEILYGPPNSIEGTGGGKHPKPTTGVRFDLTNPGDWFGKTQPIVVVPEPEEPDARFTVDLGLASPLYEKPTDHPLTKSRWYMDIDGRRQTWRKPDTPALHTKNKCGTNDSPILDIPENASSVEFIVNNLGPTAHTIHLHGMKFQVINVANYSWCNINATACFLMPFQLNPCPKEDRGLSDKNSSAPLEDLYWGCKYNATKYQAQQNLSAPLRKDSFQLWQRSWAVLRIHAWTPGVYQFHCHEEHHVALGLMMALNILPSQQPPIPETVPTEGPCPVWATTKPSIGHHHGNSTTVKVFSSSEDLDVVDGLDNRKLMKENEKLQHHIANLEHKLRQSQCGSNNSNST